MISNYMLWPFTADCNNNNNNNDDVWS